MMDFGKSIVGGFTVKPKKEELEIIYREGPECEECDGTGEVMVAKLYPNGHTEVTETCEACDGEGFIFSPESEGAL